MGIAVLPAIFELRHCGMVLVSSLWWADYEVKLHWLTALSGVCSNNSKHDYFFKKQIETWRKNKEPPTSKHFKQHHKRPDVARLCFIWTSSNESSLRSSEGFNQYLVTQGNKVHDYLATCGTVESSFSFLGGRSEKEERRNIKLYKDETKNLSSSIFFSPYITQRIGAIPVPVIQIVSRTMKISVAIIITRKNI